MIQTISDRQNLLTAGAITTAGALTGYGTAKFKEKADKQLLQETLDYIDNQKDIPDRRIFEDCKNNPEYALKIDTFEKENKVFGTDYGPEDILNDEEKVQYQKAKKEFLAKIETQKENIIKMSREDMKAVKRNIIGAFTIAGILAGAAVIFIKDRVNKKNENSAN